MKNFLLLFFITLNFCGCEVNQTQQISETNSQNKLVNKSDSEEFSIPDFSIESLPKDKKTEFNKILPAKAREVLENSEALKITVKETASLNDKGKVVDLQDKELKTKLLNAFYTDVAESISFTKNSSYAACISPKHLIRTEDGNVKIEISYDCHKFYLKGDYGNTVGSMRRNDSQAVKVFYEIIEKYQESIR
jgi:hypothetical protein